LTRNEQWKQFRNAFRISDAVPIRQSAKRREKYMSRDPLTVEDFASCEWQKVISLATDKTIKHYSSAFGAAMDQCQVLGEIAHTRAYQFLMALTSMRRNVDAEAEPYAEAIKLVDGSRSMNLNDIGTTEILIIETLAANTADPELKAFFNDLLWIKKRSHIAARLAVQAFLESARYLEDHADSTEYVARLERAAAIAASLGAKNAELRLACSRISVTLDRVSATDEGFTSKNLMLILLGVNAGDPQKCSELCETLARRAEASNKWRVARAYWNLKGDWHVRANDDQKANEAKLLAAETYVSESDLVLATENKIRRGRPAYLLTRWTPYGMLTRHRLVFRKFTGDSSKCSRSRCRR
jgi:hypothetical protein